MLMPPEIAKPPTLPSFAHVRAMTDEIGMFEHANPRRESGYLVDDMARLLIVAVREPSDRQVVRELTQTAFRFIAESQNVHGRVRNRRSAHGRWTGRHGVEDCWGRSLWAFGTAARRAPDERMRTSALSYFGHGASQRSPHRRAMAFAGLGAVEAAEFDVHHHGARRLLADTIAAVGPLGTDTDWPWPEPRLTYANAAIPEALIAAGNALDLPDVVADGLLLLRWLVDHETSDGHLSPTAVGGAGPNTERCRFDQQPIEVAAIADACHRAHLITGDDEWRRCVDLAIGWFAGDNDLGAVMWDPDSHGGYDALTSTGPSINQGAESTLALISTYQLRKREPANTSTP
jgi:hypothetical protein